MNPSRLAKAALAAVLLAGLQWPARADGASDPVDTRQLVMYTQQSAEVRELRRIYQEAGRVLPVAGFPISAPTLAELAEALAAQTTDPVTAANVAEYLQGLAFKPQALELSIWNRWSLEGYLHSGAPAPDLRRDYLERRPLGELTLAWARPDKAAILAEGYLGREYTTQYAESNLPDSESGNPVALENREVIKGYFWYNFDPLELEFGRDKVHFGPLRSSLLPSDSLPFMDMLRVTLPLGRLTMDLMISSLDNHEATDGDVSPGPSPDFGFNRTIILANLHRFEYDFGFLRAAISGLCVYARPNNTFALADFFPVFSWHAGDITPNNLSLIFDLDAVLFPGFRVMAQFGFDDISTKGIGVGDEDIPTIPAVIAGVEYLRRLPWGALSLYAEGGYTHYLWGNFDNSSGEWALGRAIYRLALDRGTYILPLTSPYGPGAIWATAEASLEGRGALRDLSARLFGELVFSLFDNAADGLLIDYKTDNAIRDGPRHGRHRVGVDLRYTPRPWLQLYTRPVVYFGSADTWFETTLGLSAIIDKRYAVKERAGR
jgi:hypothetical protein